MAQLSQGGPEARTRLRRQAAWRLTERVTDEMTNRLSALPVEVRTRGLTTAVAILVREGGVENSRILRALAEWLGLQPFLKELRLPQNADGPALLSALLDPRVPDGVVLELAEEEALRFLGEAKLLARASKD